MSENKYEHIPGFTDANGKQVPGYEITDVFGNYLAKLILAEPVIHQMNFPRLRFPRLLSFGYSSADYYKIAYLILSKDIRIFETKETKNAGYFGAYHTSDKFILTPALTKDPQKYLGTILHEATHAIQDLKKWRESERDREVDAHFAAAYFMVLKGQEGLLKPSRYGGFIALAKSVKENKGYFKTSEFRQKARTLGSSITQEYGWKFRDEPEKVENFHKRRRWDGIAA